MAPSPLPEVAAAPPATEDQSDTADTTTATKAPKTPTRAMDAREETEPQGKYQWKIPANQVSDAIEIFTDYMKMIDGRKRRQTEAEKCKLKLAWMILRRRHERRHEQAETIAVATPPRKIKTRSPESPTNPMEELRMTHKEINAEEKQAKIARLKQRKRTLERSFHETQINQHRVKFKFQAVLNEIKTRKGMNGKISVIIKQLKMMHKNKQKKKRYESIFEAALLEDWEGWGAEADEADWYDDKYDWYDAGWYDWQDDNQPAVPAVTTQKATTKETQQPRKQYTELQRKYTKLMTAANRALVEADEAVEQPYHWFRDTTMDENDNNHYFWHRGRPPEGDY
jgi:hypothetical protein